MSLKRVIGGLGLIAAMAASSLDTLLAEEPAKTTEAPKDEAKPEEPKLYGDKKPDQECYDLIARIAENHKQFYVMLKERKKKFKEVAEEYRALMQTDVEKAKTYDLAVLVKDEKVTPEQKQELGDAFGDFGHVFSLKKKESISFIYEKLSVFLKPNDPIAHYNLGITLYELGNKPEALVSLRRTLELNPDYVNAKEWIKYIETH